MEAYLVPVNDDFCEMMNWAVRYSLGRRTYAVQDTCRYVTPLIPYFDAKTIAAMIGDITRQHDLGDDCDKRCWLELKAALITELNLRVERGEWHVQIQREM